MTPPPEESRDGEKPQSDFEDFFENSLNGYLISTPGGILLRANSRVAGWIGRTPEQLAGGRLSDILTVGGRILYETHLSPLLRMQGYFEEMTLELRGADGKRVPVFVNALEKRDAASQVSVIHTLFKASNRVVYEKSLRDARNVAEGSLSDERDARNVAEGNLSDERDARNVAEGSLSDERDARNVAEGSLLDERDARNVAEGSLSDERVTSALREQFIAVLGHDLRNPLTAITTGIGFLGDISPLNEQGALLAQTIQSSAARMSELISNVMDFARGRLGDGITLTRGDTFLEPILRHVVEELRTGHPGREIHTEFTLPGRIHCDPVRLSQLLSNLTGNALTHGEPGGTVVVRAREDAGHFELCVSNTGPPIPAAALDRLFQPFTRDEVRPSMQGLGLGLYIASQIARAHGGELKADSTATETRFTFRMPLLE